MNLDIARGDLAAIMGPSGSGKSTLMNIIGLLDRAKHGRYLLQGREIGSMSDDELAALRNATIGFVFQSFHLLPRLNAWRNVGLPLVYRGIERREIRGRAHAMLEKVAPRTSSAWRPSRSSPRRTSSACTASNPTRPTGSARGSGRSRRISRSTRSSASPGSRGPTRSIPATGCSRRIPTSPRPARRTASPSSARGPRPCACSATRPAPARWRSRPVFR